MGKATNSRSRRRRSKGAGGYLRRLVQGAINRVDFAALARMIEATEAAAPLREFFADMPSAFPQQEAIRQKAVELTLHQLGEEGVPADPADIRAMIAGIACEYDHALHRQCATVVNLLMTTLFSQIAPDLPFVSPDRREVAHLDRLRAFREQGLGVVYLVNHSSHLDEFLLASLLGRCRMGLPLFAAGANMFAVPSLGRLLRLGSYVVQRRGASRAGLASLASYCQALSETGGQQAIFLEAWHGGARSRDGSLRYPRRLITLRGALAGEADRVVQPVAISYSVVPEDLSLAARQGALTWLRGLNPLFLLLNLALHPRRLPLKPFAGLYGRAFISFTPPRLLSELKQAHQADRGGLMLDEYVALTAIRDIACHKKIMASQLVARALFHARRRGGLALAAAYQEELTQLSEYHQQTFGQPPDLEDFIRDHSPAEVLAEGLATLRRRRVVARLGTDQSGLPQVRNEAGLSFYATHGDRRIYSPTAEENMVVAGADDLAFAYTYLVGNRMLEEKRYLNASLTLYDDRPEVAPEMGILRRPPGRFESYRLPKNAFVTADPPSAFRKASEVILASPAERLAEQAAVLLEHSAQPCRVVVATCGFEPHTHRLPCQVLYDLLAKKPHSGVAVYALAGAVSEPEILEGHEVFGVLAGPSPDLNRLADLFKTPQVTLELSDDPLGVQAAVILARIYALWVHVVIRSGAIKGSGPVGRFAAQAASEATRLGLALGGKPATFAAGAPAWTATFAAEALSRPYREFGGHLAAVAKRKGRLAATARRVYQAALEQGFRMAAYQDLPSAHLAARERGLALPILAEAHAALWEE